MFTTEGNENRRNDSFDKELITNPTIKRLFYASDGYRNITYQYSIKIIYRIEFFLKILFTKNYLSIQTLYFGFHALHA